MQEKRPNFEDLVTAEAGIRMESVYRRQYVMLSEGKETVSYKVDNPDAGNTRAEVSKKLLDTFLHIYDYAYQDSAQHHNTVQGAAINTADLGPEQLKATKAIFDRFVEKYYGEDGQLTIKKEDGPAVMQELYTSLREAPLPHSQLARGGLIVQMGRNGKWKPLFPNEVKFTRGEPQYDEHGERVSLDKIDLAKRFKEAFEAPDHAPSSAPDYKALPESFVTIGGLNFAAKSDDEGHHTHLVTQSGHIVAFTKKLMDNIERQITSSTHDGSVALDNLKVDVSHAPRLGDFERPDKNRHLVSRLASKVRAMPVRKEIDGFSAVDTEGKATLMCMQADFLTGLNTQAPKDGKSEVDTLKSFMTSHGVKDGFAGLIPESFYSTNIYALKHHAEREAKGKELGLIVRHTLEGLRDTARKENNSEVAMLIERAIPHLQVAMPRIYVSADKQFVLTEDKTGQYVLPEDARRVGDKLLKVPPLGHKRMYMTMGGTASGKGGIKRIAMGECDQGRTLVVASLDDARSECDKYWLYAATNNHNDDYKSVEQYGNTIRDLITSRAMHGGYNLLIDGSGVPYEGRNDEKVADFKHHGYETSVFAVQLPLYINTPKRAGYLKDGDTIDDATYRMENRMAEDQRGLIFKIVAEKHIGFALASRNAARDPNVDRFMVLDSSIPKAGRSSTLSYVLTLNEQQMHSIVNLSGYALKQALENDQQAREEDKKSLVPSWVSLPDPKQLKEKEDYNIKVVRNNGDGTYRVEIISDMEKYVAMVQKGLLKRDVKSPDALYDNAIHSDVAGRFMDDHGRLKLQQPSDLTLKPIPRHQKLMMQSTPSSRSL